MLTIDIENSIMLLVENGIEKRIDFKSSEGFDLLSSYWLRCGWETKHVYSFTWFGRPIIQLPEDIIRIQELIFSIKPDLIIETGVAHGGSLVFYASLCKLLSKGHVIGIDIDIRKHNREAIESHPLFPYITLIEGDSKSDDVVLKVSQMVGSNQKVLVILDSCHTKDHVLKELEIYSNFVSPDSYIIAMDGIMGSLVGASRSSDDWGWNNPKGAVDEFLRNNDKFILDDPKFLFNEGSVKNRVTYSPGGFIKKVA